MGDNVMVRAALLGASGGARSATPIAALAQRRRSRWARGITAAAAVAELIGDKLPQAPSRLTPLPFASRLAVGALVGGWYARSAGHAVLAPALVGAVAAGAATVGGVAWRSFAARHRLSWPAAIAEDAAAVALARAAVKR
ncbi:hypothetical protein [Actinoplanes sp. TFC3]|uniref:hypothetical protein n=1 Tax=Actinoplanes sp. TFC3 TaxID=1710355 RepID=UPI000830C944|nr:hypothetical protein [Actinoplanes sp. TFC3]